MQSKEWGNVNSKWEQTYRVEAAESEANLSWGVGRDGAVGIVHHRVEGAAECLHRLDQV